MKMATVPCPPKFARLEISRAESTIIASAHKFRNKF
jgi:hypothetical protein